MELKPGTRLKSAVDTTEVVVVRPGSGDVDVRCGGVPMGDNMVNVPVPAYTRGMDVRELIDMYWIPRLEEFKPEMVFISAGFDAHREDDLGQLGLVEADYEWITRRLVEVARRHSQGRIVSCLEGGYVLSALARSVAAHLRVLADV